jgi:hypothetical protein
MDALAIWRFFTLQVFSGRAVVSAGLGLDLYGT